MWFKSDISIYDRDDFQLAWEECHCLSNVWEWIQRESIKQESGTIRIKNSLYLRATLKRLRVSEAEFRDAQKLLGELELIIFDNPNEITLPNWLSNQGLYFARKQSESARKAEYRDKKKHDLKENVPGTIQGQGRDVRGKSDIREDKSREEEIRVNNINKYIPEFSANETNLTDKSVDTHSFSNQNNFLTHNTNSLNQESESKSEKLEAKPKEVGQFGGELLPKGKELEVKPKRFIPPTELEVADCLHNEYSKRFKVFENRRECENLAFKFWSWYDGNGWKVGKNKMKVWKSALAGWIPNYVDGKSQSVPVKQVVRGGIDCKEVLVPQITEEEREKTKQKLKQMSEELSKKFGMNQLNNKELAHV